MAMSSSLPGFLRRSAKSNEKVGIQNDEKVNALQNNPNNRAQWVDSVLQSIKTAAAAAAVPSAKLNNNGTHSSKFSEHALNKISKTTAVVHTASNRIVESPTNNILSQPHHTVNPYINDDVSEISDSPHFRTNQKIPIPSFSRMYQEMTQVQPRTQVVKVPLKKSILRQTSFDNDNGEQLYENNNGFPERVARYMQPLKRQQSANSNTVPLKEEGNSQRGFAIRSPSYSKGDSSGKGAGLVLQPRHVEPTSRLQSTQQYIVTGITYNIITVPFVSNVFECSLYVYVQIRPHYLRRRSGFQTRSAIRYGAVGRSQDRRHRIALLAIRTMRSHWLALYRMIITIQVPQVLPLVWPHRIHRTRRYSTHPPPHHRHPLLL